MFLKILFFIKNIATPLKVFFMFVSVNSVFLVLPILMNRFFVALTLNVSNKFLYAIKASILFLKLNHNCKA